MYGGSLGQRIVEFLIGQGSLLRGDDFVAHRVEWVEPLSVDYRGVQVTQVPPNTQGIALLQILNMLGSCDVGGLDAAERVHQLVERKKLAFADRDAFVGDPAWVEVPVERLLDPVYARRRASVIGPEAASYAAGRGSPDGDTIYLCAADRDGRVVSLIQSLFSGWGAGVQVPGLGITLHNRGWAFRLEAGHPNALAPDKRPLHTLMPGFALRDGQPWLAFGTRGADAQPQTGLQLLTGLLDLGLDLQAAIEAPRWVHAAPGDRFPRDAVVLEARFGQSVADDLVARGHQVVVTDPLDLVMGTAQMIQVDQQRGCYIAATDPRGDGVALAI
jgi:gamma-glutamyltranspeptidase/glutathione hydrolase